MKVLHLSTADLGGGAARAAYRLHKGLDNTGIVSQTLVRTKTTVNDSVIKDSSPLTKLSPPLNRWYLRQLGRYPEAIFSPGIFSPQWFSGPIVTKVKELNPDIVHLHWICDGFVSIESLSKIQKPIVWTFHDMWPFTGGCHYTDRCTRYQNGCGQCPLLKSTHQHDLSAKVLRRKAKAWKKLDLTVITPSHWLAQCVRVSFLFENRRVEVIPNGIDTQTFSPIEKPLARRILNLPLNKKIVLFGSGNPIGDSRKGFSLLLESLNKLSFQNSEATETYNLVVMGMDTPSIPIHLSFKTHYLGKLTDEVSLALAYSAADVFVAPSKQDNLPNTVMEALACGIPCVAFEIGGMQDMIEHQKNGYLAKPFDVVNLAHGIQWILEDRTRYHLLSEYAQIKVEKEFNILLQVRHHISLYKSLMV